MIISTSSSRLSTQIRVVGTQYTPAAVVSCTGASTESVHAGCGAAGGASAVASLGAGSGAGSGAKSCSRGKHAVIGGAHKCLAQGQFCARSQERTYHRYGFHCHKRDARGNYHLS